MEGHGRHGTAPGGGTGGEPAAEASIAGVSIAEAPMPEGWQRSDPRFIRLSRLTAAWVHAVWLLLGGIWLAVALALDWPWIPAVAVMGLAVLSAAVFVGLVPTLRWRRFAYRVDEQEIEIRKGLVTLQQVRVPMAKVQHVELESGPLMRRADLANVTVVTAATSHRIYGLSRERAETVSKQIAAWARVRDEDV